jgi:hypothetical protein
MIMLKKYLDDLESRIDANQEDILIDHWRKFVHDEISEDLFIPKREYTAPETLEYPTILGNKAMKDMDLMMLRELKGCSNLLTSNVGSLLNVRANYSVGILPSMFGAEIFYSDDKLNLMPITKKMAPDQINKVLEKGVPDIGAGLIPHVFEFGHYFNELIAGYPKMKKYIHHYHPDFQGPLDVVELLWGTELFTDVLMEPQKVKDLLELVTDTYIMLMKKWYKEFPPYYDDMEVHWGLMMPGHVMIRDDSATNFSPDLVQELVLPYNQRILDEFNGGSIHFCGNGTHFIEDFSNLDKMWGIQLSQPDYNDMDTIFKHTVDKNIKLLGLRQDGVEMALEQNRPLKGQIHTGEFIFHTTSSKKG